MLLALALLVLQGSADVAADAGPTPLLAQGDVVPSAEVAQEAAWLTSLGLRIPDAGVVLERPYAPPLTRRSFVVPHTWFRTASPASVSAAALAEDVDVLREAMQRAYGGWQTAAARGWDWEGWFRDWKAQLVSRGTATLPLEEAFAPVRHLMEFQLDNHTNIPLSPKTYFGSGSTVVLLAFAPMGLCTELRSASGQTFPLAPHDAGQQPHRAQVWDGKALRAVSYLSYPMQRGAVTQVHCGTAWVKAVPVFEPAPLNVFRPSPAREQAILGLSKETHDHPFVTRLAPGVAYMRLPTFTKENAIDIEQHLASWPKATAEDRVLIVDLRDNSGGDVAEEALAGWVEEDRLMAAFHNSTTHRGASCLYPALRWGYTALTSSHLKPPLPKEMVDELQQMLDALDGPSEPGCPPRYQDVKGSWNYTMHRAAHPGPVDGRRRILALVNNGCGSDCELMTYLLASLPETVVVGSNTYGVAQYIQPGYSVLPRTRLAFRIALGTSDLYGDQRSVDGYGLDVDVVLATQASASPEAILQLARYYAGPGPAARH
jgi:Peptidase family S41